jgi:hypothetical protein
MRSMAFFAIEIDTLLVTLSEKFMGFFTLYFLLVLYGIWHALACLSLLIFRLRLFDGCLLLLCFNGEEGCPFL